MEEILKVENLCKNYESFSLKNVSFSLNKGQIMGFIGRNGAGKTTTIKSILNFISKDGGKVEIFGKNFEENEEEIKLMLGYASGGNSYYLRKTLKQIINVTKKFYSNWDNEKYNYYMNKFSLNENKKVIELSQGMKVKFQLVMALSHNAKLLILDEPTSGLDPISREELLEIFLDLTSEGVTIFFSTHITSDLDKCADAITYIKNGEIISSCLKKEFINSYMLVTFAEKLEESQENLLLGVSRTTDYKMGLILKENEKYFSKEQLSIPNLETIMLHLEKN